MKRLLLAVLLLAPLTASAQTLPKQAGYKLCEPGATGSDCVTVGPMGAITGSPACIPESDSTPYDTCVTAPTAVPTATPQPTPTPIPPGGSSGNLQTNNGSGGFGAYAGSACPTPGMVISTNASGAHTCATPVPPTPVPTATPGSGTGDITDVMDCASGDCSTITAGASDVLDMAAALRTSACRVDTSAPGTCTVGDCFFDSDATAGANLFGCTATDTWTAQGGGGGGITGTLTDDRVTLSSGAGTVTDDSALTFDRTNNRLAVTGATTAADDSAYMLQVAGTLPASPSGASVRGVGFNITSAGSSVTANQMAVRGQLLAGYTGSQATVGVHGLNDALGTGADLNLNTTDEAPDANMGVAGTVGSSGSTGAGISIGVRGTARRSTTTNVGAYGKADNAVAGNNIGVLGNASASTEATDLKNVGVYGTLNSSLLTGVNGSFAGLFDGGTLPDSLSNVVRVIGTLPTVPTTSALGISNVITSAGSASFGQFGMLTQLAAGYTGTSGNAAILGDSRVAGTGTTLNLGTATSPTISVGLRGLHTSGATSGVIAGVLGEGNTAGTGSNFGGFFKAATATAGNNIAVLGSAGQSTEATNLKNVGGYFTLGTALVTSNISSALIADNGAEAAPIFNAYDNGTLVFSITDGGGITTTGGATGQSGTFTIRDGGGAADCNLVFVNGILDSSTC